MSKFPFVVTPRYQPIIDRVGSEEAGYIEIERKGYLTSGEKTFVQQIQQQDAGTMRLVSLSRKVASQKNITLEKAYANIMDLFSGKHKTKLMEQIELDYADEIQDVLGQLVNTRSREELVHAACLAMNRISSDITFEDVRALHPDIITGLSELYREEESKSIERLISNSEQPEQEVINVDEIEKKQS